MIEEKWTRLQIIFEEIIKVVADADKRAEIASQEDFRDEMTRLRVETLRAIRPITTTAAAIQPIATAVNTDLDRDRTLPGLAVAARLPRLELKTFKGNYVDWLP